jgi:hypothetical protein
MGSNGFFYALTESFQHESDCLPSSRKHGIGAVHEMFQLGVGLVANFFLQNDTVACFVVI